MTVQSGLLAKDSVRLDVTATNLPDHFLGTAFDLVVPATWTFEHAELCGAFSSKGEDLFNIVSSQPATHRVVFGLAAAGGKDLQLSDGCMASFYFRDALAGGNIGFEHTTLSVYRNGRHDLADARWEGISLGSHVLNSSGVHPVSDVLQSGLSQELVGPPAVLQHGAGIQAGKADVFFPVDSSLLNVYLAIIATFALALAVFGVILAYFRLRSKK